MWIKIISNLFFLGQDLVLFVRGSFVICRRFEGIYGRFEGILFIVSLFSYYFDIYDSKLRLIYFFKNVIEIWVTEYQRGFGRVMVWFFGFYFRFEKRATGEVILGLCFGFQILAFCIRYVQGDFIVFFISGFIEVGSYFQFVENVRG